MSVWSVGRSVCVGCIALVAAIASGSAFGQSRVVLDLLPVNAAGNAPVPRSMVPLLGNQFPTLGAVDHNFYMNRTEITAGQWYQFVRAYAPYYTGNPLDAAFTSFYITPDALTGPNITYTLDTGAERLPVSVGWRYAAIFCNWMTNNQATTREAFMSGAYDVSTFGGPVGGPYSDQLAHTPGATYWLPTLDEWTAAMHYDPNRFGTNQPCYWRYPTSSDTVPVSELPQNGGQTNAGTGIPFGVAISMPVGSYPSIQSPWGMLDGSGGASEWLETGDDFTRYLRGSRARGSQFEDRIDNLNSVYSPDAGLFGIRIASSIPTPTTTLTLLLAAASSTRRPRREAANRPHSLKQ